MKKVVKIIFVNSFLLLLLLAIVEIAFRWNGYRSGLIVDPNHFHEVDPLIAYKDYDADENGITKISQDAREIIAKHISDSAVADEPDFGDIKALIDDFRKLRNKGTAGPFAEFIYSLKEKPNDNLSDDENAYLDYCRSPVNTDGFRSIEFKNYPTQKRKVLLLGDSHTWGGNAFPIVNSFADILSAKGFIIFNTGIVATDPVQYDLVARKYVPALKPDVVIVTFCMNNDRLNFKRKTEPYRQLMYPTNAGYIMAAPMGEFFKSPAEAYDFMKAEFFIPNKKTNFFNRICSTTVLTTKIWVLLRNNGVIVPEHDEKYSAYYEKIQAIAANQPVSEEYLENIKNVCAENEARFILAVIPEAENINPSLEKDYPGLFHNMVPAIPQGMTINDYYDTGFDVGHYNNDGHRKYADFLEYLIDSAMAK